MTLPVNTIIAGDCLEVLKTFPDKCVDLVFTSPPYEDCRTYGIDFKLKGQEWVDWLVPIIQQSLRLCKGLVAFVVEGKTKQFRWSAVPALLMADLHRAGIHLRKPPVFKRNGVPGSGGPDWLRNDYEFIVCCTDGGKLPWSDNVAMGHPPKWGPGGAMSNRLKTGRRVNQWGGSNGKTRFGRKRDGSIDKNPRPSHKTGYKLPALANPGNIIDCGSVGGGRMGSRLAHENEAPFPEKLAEFFIKSFCPPSGTVVDCFSGSGTTVSVAEQLGRKWVAIDIRQSQCDLTAKRVKEQNAGQLALFGKEGA